jgi:ABC-2 type transport system ATP-binding protein
VPATISVRDLRKSYGPVRAVDGVSFEVQRGEFFGILGPNGAGKTTTLEIVEGLRQADSGTVSVLGLPAWPRNPALLPRIGVQLQASSFFERLTAREQLQTFAMLRDRRRCFADDRHP